MEKDLINSSEWGETMRGSLVVMALLQMRGARLKDTMIVKRRLTLYGCIDNV